jgi:predicted dehydrogenase
MSQTKRFIVVGTGGRAKMYIDALATRFPGEAELAGLCDFSQVRMDWHNQSLAREYGVEPLPTCRPEQFDQFIRAQKANGVVVCTMDSTHHDYVVRAMDLDCDVVCEKPLTIDAEKACAILEATERTGRTLRVGHNCRYIPFMSKVKQLVMSGVIGRPLMVDLMWVLDVVHGADYFRRWHREKDKSGGLLIHKASHHFDLVNWWIDSWPKTVYADGDLAFYGKANAEQRGEQYDYDRYTGSPEAHNDPFYLPLDREQPVFGFDADIMRGLYLDAESETGYVRDRNVFGEGITIEDRMALNVRYDNGVLFNYTLIAFSPWEGMRLAITGERGRIELYKCYRGHLPPGHPNAIGDQDDAAKEETSICVYPMFGTPYRVDIPKGKGSHGGGDELILRDLFATHPGEDPWRRRTDHLEGTAAVLVGISANESIRTGQPVTCRDLVPMPQHPTPQQAVTT